MQLCTRVKSVTHSCRYKGWLPQFTCDIASPTVELAQFLLEDFFLFHTIVELPTHL